jgi:hypothetical protein
MNVNSYQFGPAHFIYERKSANNDIMMLTVRWTIIIENVVLCHATVTIVLSQWYCRIVTTLLSQWYCRIVTIVLSQWYCRIVIIVLWPSYCRIVTKMATVRWWQCDSTNHLPLTMFVPRQCLSYELTNGTAMVLPGCPFVPEIMYTGAHEVFLHQ